MSKRDLDIAGIREAWKKEGGGIGCKVGEYAWIGKRGRDKIASIGRRGGVGFLVKECLCDIIEVIKGTEFNKRI